MGPWALFSVTGLPETCREVAQLGFAQDVDNKQRVQGGKDWAWSCEAEVV